MTVGTAVLEVCLTLCKGTFAWPDEQGGGRLQD